MLLRTLASTEVTYKSIPEDADVLDKQFAYLNKISVSRFIDHFALRGRIVEDLLEKREHMVIGGREPVSPKQESRGIAHKLLCLFPYFIKNLFPTLVIVFQPSVLLKQKRYDYRRILRAIVFKEVAPIIPWRPSQRHFRRRFN